jgi:hypothetical protein
MGATNISINQENNIAINISTLKTNIQSALKRANVGTLVSGLRFKVSLKSLYRKQLRLTMAAARTIEAHPTLTNVILIAMCAMLVYEVLNYEFTTSL